MHVALQLERHRLSLAVDRGPHRQAHPALADAIFVDVGFLHALESHTDPPDERFGVVVRAVRVDGQPVGRRIAHGYENRSRI